MDSPSDHIPDLTASLENYIETIYVLEKETRVARVKDIARKMDVKMSTVTSALKRLSELKMVHYDPYSVITLTSDGKKVAKRLSRRHKALANFFEKVLFVDSEVAQESAIRVEHVIDEELFERFVAFADFLESCPKVGVMWKEDRGFSCATRDKDSLCRCTRTEEKSSSHHDAHRVKPLKIRISLDLLPVGISGKVKRLPMDMTVREACVQAGLAAGAQVTVVARDTEKDTLSIRINTIEKTLSTAAASQIIIKPNSILLRRLGEGNKAVIRRVAIRSDELKKAGVVSNAKCIVSALHPESETMDVVLDDSHVSLTFAQADEILVTPYA